MRIIVVFVVILSLGACKQEPESSILAGACSNAGTPDNDHEQSEALQHLLELHTHGGIPGVTAVVHSESQGFFAGASGVVNIENGQALELCHTFRVASLTKTFMATAILQLAASGQVNLEAPISDYLDDHVLQDLDKAYETTVAELLNHTSGIANYDDNSRFVAQVLNEPGEPISVGERLDFARALGGTRDDVIEQYGPPYSNTNYVLLQLILEKVTGQGFEAYFQEFILDPLMLEHTSFSTMESFPNNLCAGYCDMYDNGKLREVSLFDARRWSGEAAMISNAVDVHHFFSALLSGQLTTQETLDQMIDQNLGLLEEDFDGHTAFGHDGQAAGYSSEMWYFPEHELTIILIANQGRISSDQPSIQNFEQLMVDVLRVHL